LEHHPDKAGAAIADEDTKSAIEEKFKAIQEAYETLSDPSRRSLWTALLRTSSRQGSLIALQPAGPSSCHRAVGVLS
jgi:DnaJ-class molecular chaperone